MAFLVPSKAVPQQFVDLPGTHSPEEIKLKCDAAGGQYFEDVSFGDYGCKNESRRHKLSCSLNSLKCTLRLNAGMMGHGGQFEKPGLW
jgi:hypothetical protein